MPSAYCMYSTRSYLHKVLFAILLTIFIIHTAKSQVNSPVFTVVLDAGHGGRDPGCLGKNSMEKDLALDVTLLTGRKIRALFPQINVVYTRKTDVFVPLGKRAQIANDINADLFISIHCNYAPKKPHVQGTETFVMGLHKAASNLEVVKRENSVIEFENDKEIYNELDPNSPLGHIILQNRQNTNLEESILVASAIQNNFTEKLNRNNRGVKQAGFLVLYHTTMPSVLVELGFLSNKEEEAYCMSKSGQSDLANSLSQAVSKYLEITHPENNPVFARTATKTNKNNIDEKKPVSYKIQVAASKNKPLIIEEREPWTKVNGYEIVAEKGLYKYLTGNFLSLQNATEEKNRLREEGFPDAFVVAYKGMNRISVDH